MSNRPPDGHWVGVGSGDVQGMDMFSERGYMSVLREAISYHRDLSYDACDVTKSATPRFRGQTDTCENIVLLATPFVGGKNVLAEVR